MATKRTPVIHSDTTLSGCRGDFAGLVTSCIDEHTLFLCVRLTSDERRLLATLLLLVITGCCDADDVGISCSLL